MNIIIAGCRDFNDYELLKKRCDKIIEDINTEDPITIISGGALGADRLGERYAQERGYNIKVFSADWDKHGKSAGPIRNQSMVDIGDRLIAFWDKKSKGTEDIITKAFIKSLKTYVVFIDE